MAWILVGQRRRRRVIAPAPDLHLFVAELGRGLGLVESLQPTVMPLVQSPRPMDGNPHHVEFVQRDPQRPDGAFEYRRICDVELILLGAHQASGLARLFATFVAEIDVRPTGESVLLVPSALAVTKQYEPKHCSPL